MKRDEHYHWHRLPEAPENSRANRGLPWSEEDDDRLRELYTTHGCEYAAAVLGRTRGAVASRATMLRIPGFDSALLERVAEGEEKKEIEAGEIDERFAPTVNMLNAILRMIGHREIEEIADLFETTPATIRDLARFHGRLPRRVSDDWTPREDRTLRRQWNRERPSFIASRLGRSVYAVKRRAAELGLVRDARRWTAEEEAFLRANVGRLSRTEIARALRRTPAAVTARIAQLRSGSGRTVPAMWSDDDDRFLREHYQQMPAAEIARTLGRSHRAVIARAGQLGVCARRWVAWEEERLRELYGTVSAQEIARDLGRTKGAIETKIMRLGLADEKRSTWKYYDTANDETLRRLYGSVPADELARRVGLPRYRLPYHLRRLGLIETQRRWSADDDAYLRRTLETRTYEEIGLHLGYSAGGVRARAIHLGLSREGARRQWSAEDDAYLRRHYPTGDLDAITAHLGRTSNAVVLRARRLGVRRRN